jgi:hypothetical protein
MSLSATPRSGFGVWTPPSKNTAGRSMSDTAIAWSIWPEAYALQGKMEEAKSVLAEALRANPKLTLKMLMDRSLVPPVLAEGLRKAGLPEE